MKKLILGLMLAGAVAAVPMLGHHSFAAEYDSKKPVTLKGEFSSPVKDPWGNQRSALSVSGELNRTDWGLGWNMALEAGGFVVSEKVKLSVEVEAVAVAVETPVAA